jgi:hypothetical protein
VSFLLVANPSSGSDGGDLAGRADRELDDVRTLLREGIDLHDGVRRGMEEGRTVDVRIMPVPTGLRGGSRFAWGVARAHPFNGRVVRTTAEEVEMRLRVGPRAVAFEGEGDEQLEGARVAIEPEALRVLVPAAAEARTSRS